LPGAILIAHEVGHVVNSDFDLSDQISAALDSAGLKHCEVWKGWVSEMFADVYGCCAMGPSFAAAMIDLNATSVQAVQRDDRPSSGPYPPRNLRVRLLCETLRQTGHGPAAERLLTGWVAVYGEMTTMRDYFDELPAVAKSLLSGPYRGIALTQLIQFPSEWSAAIERIGQSASQGLVAALKDQTDPRQLFAAARWLHENPQWNGPQRFDLLIYQMTAKSESAVRTINRENRPASRSLDESERLLVELERQDRLNGLKLRELMLLTGAQDPPPADAPRDPPES
jgi:hypothetical protein